MAPKKLLQRRNIRLEPVEGASRNTKEADGTTSGNKRNGDVGSTDPPNDVDFNKIEQTTNRPNNENIKQPNGNTESAPADIAQSHANTNTSSTNDIGESQKTNNKSKNKGNNPSLVGKIFSWRFFVVILLHISFFFVVFPRISMPLALVCMVDQYHSKPNVSDIVNNSTDDLVTSLYKDIVKSNNTLTLNDGAGSMGDSKEFNWDSKTEGVLLTSPLFCTFLGPLLAGLMKDFIGSKMTLTLFVTVGSLMNFIAPICARINPYLLAGNRIILGMTSAASMPIAGEYIAHWSPDTEKLTSVSFVYAGMNVGGILCSLAGGFLCSIPLDNGWPFIFYFLGIISALWVAAWFFLTSGSPEEHRFISEKEKNYIIQNRQGIDQSEQKKVAKPPYRKILTSVPMLAYMFASSCHVWNIGINFSYGPIYINAVLKFTIQQTGILFAVLVAARIVGAVIWTSLGNSLRSSGKVSVNASRKICTCIGLTTAAATTVVMSFFNEDRRWYAIGLLVFIMACQSVGTTTLAIIPLDMAPKYAGFMTGVNTSLAMLVGSSGPLIVSALTPTSSFEEWRIVWIAVAAVYVAGSTVFLFFGHAHLQPWAEPDKTATEEPHVVSSFVEMGRRFSSSFASTLSDIPHSPATPRKMRRFHFAKNVEIATVLQGICESPDAYDIPKRFNLTLEPVPRISHVIDTATQTEGIRSNQESELGVQNLGFEKDVEPCFTSGQNIKEPISDSEYYEVEFNDTPDSPCIDNAEVSRSDDTNNSKESSSTKL